jgi:hypothetical protein
MKETIIIEHTSNATISFDEANRDMFLNALASLDPDLWMIKSYLDRYNINPQAIFIYIEHLARISESPTGKGKITTEMEHGMVMTCNLSDSRDVDKPITKDYNKRVYT